MSTFCKTTPLSQRTYVRGLPSLHFQAELMKIKNVKISQLNLLVVILSTYLEDCLLMTSQSMWDIFY